MKKFYFLVFLQTFWLISCSSKAPLYNVANKTDKTIQNAVLDSIKNFGYVPIDPMPIETYDYRGFFNVTNNKYLDEMTDETILVATGTYDSNGTVTFGPIASTITGQKYIAILDWIKYTTLPQSIIRNKSGKIESYEKNSLDKTKTVGNSIPVYAGIGLRIQANFIATSSNLDVNGIFGLAGNYNSSNFKGSLIIQSMGISGKSVNLPLPSDINPTSIQNALMSISSIRALVYTSENKDLKITPRIVGFYNTVGDKAIRDEMISFLSSKPIPFPIKITVEEEIDITEKKLKLEKKLNELEKLYQDTVTSTNSQKN
ncbi:hypothetical protein [Flavobacterium ginsenosidimutans]|uniref:hypothetical protein n=1 Tax=Flavobacterium ginsenosidimutans TaxID=687844 RepID=UPI003D97DC43